MALLHVAAGDLRIAREVVDVQLNCGRARVLYGASVVRPAFGAGPVEAPNHGNIDGGGGTLEKAQVAGGTGVLLDDGRHVVERLGEALGGLVHDPRSAGFLLAELLLEEREQHDRADPRIGETSNSVEGVRKRRCRGYEWVPQL